MGTPTTNPTTPDPRAAYYILVEDRGSYTTYTGDGVETRYPTLDDAREGLAILVTELAREGNSLEGYRIALVYPPTPDPRDRL